MAQGKCPMCSSKRNAVESNEFFPFCSERCKLVDLYNWFNEEYMLEEPLPNINEDPEEPDTFWRN